MSSRQCSKSVSFFVSAPTFALSDFARVARFCSDLQRRAKNLARMDASELGRWTRFAAKGGIGKCTAVQDCMAEQAGDLMFLKVSLLAA